MSAPLGLSSLQAVLYDSGQLLSQGTLEGLQYQLQVFTSNGTFTPPTPPTGFEIAYYIGTAYEGGESGDFVGSVMNTAGQGGLFGGRRAKRISVAEMGSSQPVVVGAGGAPRTSAGAGNLGGDSWLGPSAAPLVKSSMPGTSAMPSAFGALASSSAPGSGGWGGTVTIVDTVWTYTPGGDGQPSEGAAQGLGGSNSSTFWGSSRSPTAGANGGVDGDHTFGGGGGGGGGSGVNGQGGGAGGAPGGGGGASGAYRSGQIGSGADPSGGGGRGQLDVLTVFKPIVEIA